MPDIFDVIADSNRREILRVLLECRTASGAGAGELSVSELVEALGLSQPTVSKHLKVLRDAGLVLVREEGQHRYYRLESAPIVAVEHWLSPFVGSGPEHDFGIGGTADPGSTVFSAWAGSGIPKPLRQVADSIEHSADVGSSFGRTAAEASHTVRSAIGGALDALRGVSGTVERAIIDPIRSRLGRQRDDS